MWKSIVPILFFGCQANAQPQFQSVGDTGEEEAEETNDPSLYWPEKIILDAPNNALMLIWFNTLSPRHNTLSFDKIDQFILVPSQQMRPAELQLLLKDERKFLMAFGTDARNTSQSLRALTGKKLTSAMPTAQRLMPKENIQRNVPTFVVGSSTAPDALTPPSLVRTDVETVLKRQDELFSLGEEVPEKGEGEVSKTSVDMVIKSEMSRFRSCFIKEARKNPKLAGVVVVQFSINNEGKVTGGKVKESSLNSPLVEKCLVRSIYGLRFSPPKEGIAVVTYPFSFSITGL